MFSIVPIPAFQDNYLWLLRNDKDAAIVDPGDAAPVLDYLRREKLRLVAILNTHHHADHIGGNAGLLQHYDVPVYGPHDERILQITHALREGDRVPLDALDIALSVIDVPGHTRSHIAFYSENAGIVFSGDTLFACGCGRLFEGTPAQMYASLGKLAALPDNTRVYCAHEYTLANLRFARTVEPNNPALQTWEEEAKKLRAENKPTVPSTIAQEKAGNPFLRCAMPAVIASANQKAGITLENPVEVFRVLREWKNTF